MKNTLLLIRFSALGDILLTFPALKQLKLSYPDSEIHFLTKEKFKSILETSHLVDKVHTIPDHASLRDLLACTRVLKTHTYSMVLDLHRNLRSRLVCFFLGRPHRRVRKYRFHEWVLFTLRRTSYRALGFAPLSRWREAAQTVLGTKGLVATSDEPLMVLQADFSSLSAAEIKNKNYVCICAESAWEQKCWPVDRFVQVAQGLQSSGFTVVWLGLKPLPLEAKVAGSIDLTAKLSLEQTAGVLQSSKMLLCNDSGLMHLAEVVGVPVVAIFGPTTRELGFAPRLSKSKIVESDLWCRPCSKTGRLCFRIFNKQACLKEVTVGQVLPVCKITLGLSG